LFVWTHLINAHINKVIDHSGDYLLVFQVQLIHKLLERIVVIIPQKIEHEARATENMFP
jgi:hypothetical protein